MIIILFTKSSIFAFFLRTSHFLHNKNRQIKLILITPSKTLFLYKSNKIFNNFLLLLFNDRLVDFFFK